MRGRVKFSSVSIEFEMLVVDETSSERIERIYGYVYGS